MNIIDLNQQLKITQEQILKKIGQWLSEGSGWRIDKIDNHYLNVVKYKPMKGKSYIQLPKELRHHMKGLINLQNKDNECFRWCHIRHLNPQEKYPQRVKKNDREYIKHLDYSNAEFPVKINDYNKIEKQNNININAFGYEDKQKFPIYISKEKFDDHLNLLLITENENKHYVLIKDFNRFMFNQTKHKNSKHFCMYCLQHFSSEEILNEHKNDCIAINGEQAVKMPQKGEKIMFKNYNRQLKVPFVIYADFEAMTEKVNSCKPNDNESYTESYQNHKDCGYGYKVVYACDDRYTKPIQYL